MTGQWQHAIGSQFVVSIQMLREAIRSCPKSLWDDRSDGAPFWHLAYHTLFYTDLYLSEDESSFVPREYHEPDAQYLPGENRSLGQAVATPHTVFTQQQLLRYAEDCVAKCDQTFARLTDERALERCGIPWYTLNAGDFLLNNLRHLQHHVGQLTWILRKRAGVSSEWWGGRDNHWPEPTWSE